MHVQMLSYLYSFSNIPTRTKESWFIFSKNVFILSYNNAEFKNVHSDNTPDLSVREEGSLFPFSEIVSTLLLYNNVEFKN